MRFSFYMVFKLIAISQKDKEQQAYFSIIFLSLPLFLNISTIINIITKCFSINYKFNNDSIILLITLIIVINYFIFIKRQKYLKIEILNDSLPEKEKVKMTLLSVLYILITILLFSFF